MSRAHSRSFSLAVCKALGLDPMDTAKIVIELTAGEVVRVRVEHFPTVERVETVMRLFHLSQWEQQPDAESEASQ